MLYLVHHKVLGQIFIFIKNAMSIYRNLLEKKNLKLVNDFHNYEIPR